MKALINKLSLLLIALTLTSCGGGGGTGGAFQPPPGTAQVASLSSASATTTISSNNFVDISVTAKNTDNSLAKDGTTISAVLTPASIGIITTGGAVTGGTTTSGLTTGGLVAFRFSSGVNTGVAHMVFSTVNAAGSTISTALDINVNGGAADNRLMLTPNTITLPLNPSPGSFAFLGSPYLGEVTITRRHQNGQLITGTEKDNTSIAPVQIAAFSTLDDPATPWSGATAKPPTAVGNEFLTKIGSGPVSVTGGQGTIFVHAQDKPGTATLIVTATDADSGQTISASLTVNVVATIPQLPTSVSLSTEGNAVYVSSSGGNSSATINAIVNSGAGLTVPDPTFANGAYDNIQFDIVGENLGKASLSALNAAGQQSVAGATSVKTRTFSGIATVVFNAGTTTGAILIRATVDRSDNNVDNGIQDPVTSTITIDVSDGKLYAISIASPVLSGLRVNSISGQVTSNGTSPSDPNATYSLTISAEGIDHGSHPVLPGTVINFGVMDSPVSKNFSSDSGSGSVVKFLITGPSGDPKESDVLFNAVNAHFQTAPNKPGPGDTLLLFGFSTTFDGFTAPAGNRDLEGASEIQSVVSDTALIVTHSFNANDDTGMLTDNGPVIPYVIGHATVGNITASATTNAAGVATAFITYPASHLGDYAYVWAQGTVSTATGTKTVGHIYESGYPGLAPAALFAPSSIVGNTQTTVRVCLTDALQQPLSQQLVGFVFENIGGGGAVATIDGHAGGAFANLTDSSGCTVGAVVTSGLTNAGTKSPDIVVTADGQTATIAISVGSAPLLQASPASVKEDNNVGTTVTLTLTDDHGTAISGALISGTCSTAGASTTSGAPTDANGQTFVVVTNLSLNQPVTPQTATCTYTTSNGAKVTVNVSGVNSCINTPHASGCPVTPQTSVTVNVSNSGLAANQVTGNVAISGISQGQNFSQGCNIAGNNVLVPCVNSFDQNSVVTLVATAIGAHTAFDGWVGSCGITTHTTTPVSDKAIFTVGANATACTATFKCAGPSCP